MPGTLQLFALGKPRLLLDDRPLADLVSVKAQALLFYLAVTGKTYSRSALAGLLWGDLSEESARANLRLALSKLRKVLPDHLVVSWQSISFDFQRNHDLDLKNFQIYAANPEQAALEQLNSAMELYRGDFLEDFTVQDAPEFETWMFTEREHLRRMVLKAGWQLTVSAYERGLFAEGIEAAWKVLTIEPWHEETHQQLMRLLAGSGQRSAALAQYDVCRHVLAEELGVEPSTITTQIYNQIRKSQIASPSAAPSAGPPKQAQAPVDFPIGNLPAPVTPLIGRELELNQIMERMTDPNCRLLTILGPGGIGKTRLSIAAAESLSTSFQDGVAFVSLEEASTIKKGEASETLIVNLANAIGFNFSAPQPPRELLINHLRDRTTLLVMDNMEKLQQNDKLITDILRHAPTVKLLVSSRQRLGVAGEWLLELKGLSFAEGQTEYAAATYPAIRLFIECARRLRPDFDADKDAISINRICQLVDGFPLGIELAAQWVTILPCAEIVARLERNLDMLAVSLQTAPKRHHSLRIVMDESWDALAPDERHLFQRLSVFRGGFELEAAEQGAGASLPQLAGLGNKSWLRREISGRYHIHELLRQYAAERLNARPDEELSSQNDHARYYSEFLSKRYDLLNDTYDPSVLPEIDLEINNLRIALDFYLTSRQINSIGPFIERLWGYFKCKGLFQEAVSMLEKISNLESPPAIQRGRWQLWLGEANYQMGRIARSEEHFSQALILLGEPSPNTSDEWGRALFRQIFGQILHRVWPAGFMGRKIHDRQRLLDVAAALNRIGPIAYQSGDGLRTLTAAFWNLNVAELAGSQPDLATGYTGCCISLGSLPLHSLAKHYGQLALHTAKSGLNVRTRAYTLEIVALYRSGLGRWAEAQTMLEESISLYDQLALPRGQIESRSLLAKVHYHQGRFRAARGLYEEALDISEKQGDFTGQHWNLMGLVECSLCLGESITDSIKTWLRRVNILQTEALVGRADMIRYFGAQAQVNLLCGETEHALETAQMGLRMVRQKPFAGSWTMDGYTGIAETLLLLLGMGNGGTSTSQRELKANAQEACRAVLAFSRIFRIAEPRTRLCQGWYDWLTGNRSQALQAWQKAVLLAQQLNMPYEQARAHYEIGQHLRDNDSGRLHLQQADDLFARLDISARAISLLNE